jgi:hypothetical protein
MLALLLLVAGCCDDNIYSDSQGHKRRNHSEIPFTFFAMDKQIAGF